MKLLRKLAFYASWVLMVLGFRLSNMAKDGVGDADEYKVGDTD